MRGDTGAVVSTVNVTGDETGPAFPAASNARAVTVCVASVQVREMLHRPSTPAVVRSGAPVFGVSSTRAPGCAVPSTAIVENANKEPSVGAVITGAAGAAKAAEAARISAAATSAGAAGILIRRDNGQAAWGSVVSLSPI